MPSSKLAPGRPLRKTRVRGSQVLHQQFYLLTNKKRKQKVDSNIYARAGSCAVKRRIFEIPEEGWRMFAVTFSGKTKDGCLMDAG